MNVADMQALLTAAKQFAEAANISSTAQKNLDAVCRSLEPFRAMQVADFAELLRQSEEYRRTGILPVAAKSAAKRSRKPTMSAEEKRRLVDQHVRQLQDLYAVIHEETVGYGAIDELCESVGKLNVPEVRKVAAEFGIQLAGKASKKTALDEIKRKLTEQKGSAQRVQPIGSY